MKKSNSMASLQIITNCPMCDFKYDKKNVKMIDKKDGMITVYLSCQKCRSSMMMVIMTGILGITSVSMMTDITESDLKNIKSSYIEYDDVLEMHQFLERR
ncbi:MAG: hypothetical protein KAQ87_00795 [Candidatus Pacebacteria bacterium]|nr:hypothetical protein [Candidatus Paceibacterota bacterium]